MPMETPSKPWRINSSPAAAKNLGAALVSGKACFGHRLGVYRAQTST